MALESALPPVRRWILHFGAHKTATTHMQDTLAAIRPRLLGKGIDYIPRDDLRLPLDAVLRNRTWHMAAMRLGIGRTAVRRKLDAAIKPLRKGGNTVILSEENVLGHMVTAFWNPFYKNAPLRLRAVASLQTRQVEIEVHLAIRSMETFLPSAYTQSLRHFATTPFKDVHAATMSAPPRWTNLVRTIRDEFPKANLHVWRYEDYRDHGSEMLEGICGTQLGPLPDVAPPTETVSPSAKAVAAAEQIPSDLPMPEREKKVAEIYARYPKHSGEPFRPFTDAERGVLQDVYAQDCKALKNAGLLRTFD